MGRIYRERGMRRTVANMQQQIKVQGSASVLARSGLSVPEEGVTQVDGTLHVLGDFIADGKISNDALMAPVSPLSAHTDGTNFSLATGANVAKLTMTIPVPEGYGSALVLASGNMNAYNSTANADYGYLGIRINGAAIGWSLAAYAAGGTYCAVSNSASSLLSSIGSSFTVQAACSSANADWAADVSNTINLDAMVLFLR